MLYPCSILPGWLVGSMEGWRDAALTLFAIDCFGDHVCCVIPNEKEKGVDEGRGGQKNQSPKSNGCNGSRNDILSI
jgi:hypothetical protein